MNSTSDEWALVNAGGVEHWMPVDRGPRYMPPYPELVFQGDVGQNERGDATFVPDRRPGKTMRDGGLIDLAVEVHGRRCAPTSGHWTRDRITRAGLQDDVQAPDLFGPRRVDVVRSAGCAVETVTGVEVVRLPGAPEVVRLLGTVPSRGAAHSHVTDEDSAAPELASDHLPVVARLRPAEVAAHDLV